MQSPISISEQILDEASNPARGKIISTQASFHIEDTSSHFETLKQMQIWKRILPFITLLPGNLSLLISEPHKFNFLTFRQKSIKENSRNTASPSKRFRFEISLVALC